MLNYLYRVNERPRDRSGNPRNTVDLYRLDVDSAGVIGMSLVAGEVSIGYRSETQAVCEVLIDLGVLSSEHRHGNLWRLRCDGVANIMAI